MSITSFVWRQTLSAVLVIWLAATLSFLALRILPADAIAVQLLDSGASAEVIEQRRVLLGLNDSLLAQYLRFISGILCGDLGYSLLNGDPVTQTIAQRLSPTITLAAGAWLLAVLWGISAGVWAGLPLRGAGLTRAVISLSLSMPIYWTGTLAIYAASAFSLAAIQPALPILVLGFHAAGAIARVLQSQVRDVWQNDYVRTAHAKGLPQRIVVGRHVLRVALLPIINIIALQAGFLLTGTVVTESLFARPGIGRLLVERTLGQDYPVVQGIVVLAALLYTLLNLLADVAHHLLDPRLRAFP
jgi:ABC-type dipeptide/oligopeptide/nickel transport system permease component